MSQVVFRFKKIKSVAGVVAAVGHDERLQMPSRPENADPSKRVDVIISAGEDPEEGLKKKLEGVWRRKDAVLAIEAILTASPEYFRHDPGHTEYGKWNPEKVESFRKAGEKFLRAKFGDMILSLAFHLDEATPHFQCIFVPVMDGKLNAKAVMGDREKLRSWQDEAHKAVEHLGIERGVKGSRAKHVSVKKYYENVNRPLPKVPTVKTVVPELPPRTFAESVPFSGPKKDRDAREESVRLLERKRQDEIRLREEALIKVAEQALSKARNHDVLMSRNSELQLTLIKKDSELSQKTALLEANQMEIDSLKQELKRQADRMRALPIGDVIEKVYGGKLDRYSKESHSTRMYLLGDHKIGVSPAKNGGEVWKDNQSGVGGRGAINLVMHLSNVDYKGAVRILIDSFERNEVVRETVAWVEAHIASRWVEAIAKEPAVVPAPETGTWPRVKKYLEDVRKIPGRLVEDLREKGKVWSDRFANVVFKREGGGAFLRGTGETKFMRTIGSKDVGPFILDGTESTILVEAPIDAVSLKLQRPEAKILALGGNLLRPVDVAHHVLPGKEIFLGFDKDLAGEEMVKEAKELWPDAIRLIPICKDFNEDLQTGKMLLPGDESTVPLDGLFVKQDVDGEEIGEVERSGGNCFELTM